MRKRIMVGAPEASQKIAITIGEHLYNLSHQENQSE